MSESSKSSFERLSDDSTHEHVSGWLQNQELPLKTTGIAQETVIVTPFDDDYVDSEDNSSIDEPLDPAKIEEGRWIRLPWTVEKIGDWAVRFAAVLVVVVFTANMYLKYSQASPIQILKDGLIEKANQEQDKITHALLIARAMNSFERMNMSDKLTLHQWIPDPSRFKGVGELVTQFGYNDTDIEMFLYFSQPVFIGTNSSKPKMHFEFDGLIMDKPFKIANCLFMTRCHKINYTIHEIDLYIYETFKSDHQEFRIARVYYVPIDDLL